MKKFLLVVLLMTITLFSQAQHRPYYGGGHHTTSHGGHYAGGSGSSHRGGHYRNPATHNRYGIHKARRRH